MSTLEINKIVAALLTTGVVASFSAFIATVIMHPHELEEPVYVVAGAAPEEAPADTAGEMEDDIVAMMASADEAAGEAVGKKCATCHTFDQGGADKIGPNLWNVLNRPIASHGDFGYSDALAGKSGDTWTYENLNHFLASPKDFAPGTKMSFAGLKKPEDRANLIGYLRSLSDSPAPLPEGQAAAAGEEPAAEASAAAQEPAAGEEPAAAESQDQQAAAASGEEPAAAGSQEEPSAEASTDSAADEAVAMLASADADAGQKVAKKCGACHSFDQGGPNKVGPNLWNVVERPIASVEGFGYSDDLKGLSGESWTFEHLSAFIAKPKDFAPGTKMTFAGVKKPEDRANLLGYLRSLSDSPAPLPE